jgi:hypothetical protein
MKVAEATRRKRFVIEHSRGKFTCGKQPLFQIWSQMVRNLATFGESARIEAMPVSVLTPFRVTRACGFKQSISSRGNTTAVCNRPACPAFKSHYSMTSSASARRVGGTLTSIARAVLRLMASLKRVGC